MENKEIKLDYVFDSDYAPNDLYDDYDGDDFDFEIDIDEAKEVIVDSYIKVIDAKDIKNNYFIELLDELEYEELINWDSIIKKNNDVLKDHFKKEAMEWFIENNYIMTREDYLSNEADKYNDEKWLEEHGE